MIQPLPRIAEGQTVVCVASGPSLTTEDVEYVRGKAITIAVNDAIRLMPWADCLVSADQLWWERHYRQMREFQGLKVRVNPSQHRVFVKRKDVAYCERCDARLSGKPCWCVGITTLANAGRDGFSSDPTAVVTTQNSGGMSINVAVHLGAKRIILLGYDMGPDEKGRRHFYDIGATTITSAFEMFRKSIATMVTPLAELGVEVINCSRRSALECFRREALRDALC